LQWLQRFKKYLKFIVIIKNNKTAITVAISTFVAVGMIIATLYKKNTSGRVKPAAYGLCFFMFLLKKVLTAYRVNDKVETS